MASDTVYVGQLICDSTTPPPDRGFYKINDTTTGHVGKLVMSDPVSGKESVALTATLSDVGVGNVYAGGQQVLITRTLASTGAAAGLAPNATWDNTSGAFTLGTALQRTYDKGVWLWFSGVGVVGSTGGPAASGLYWCIMSSPTSGRAYNVKGDPAGEFVPYIYVGAPPLLPTTAGSHLAMAGVAITVASVKIPAGLLRASGSIHGHDLLLYNNTVGIKRSTVTSGPAVLMSNSAGSTLYSHTCARREFFLYQIDDGTSQVSQSSVFFGTSAVQSQFTSIDMAADQYVRWTLSLDVATDVILVQHLFLEART